MKQQNAEGDSFEASPFFFVLVLSLLFLFTSLLVLVQRDIYGLETRVALFVKGVLKGEGLFCPILFGRPYPDYPPLYFLLSAPFCLLMGRVCALCISIPSLLGATALLVLVFSFTRKYAGGIQAAISSLILFATPEFFLKAERATLDMLLALSVFSSNMLLFQGFWEQEGKNRIKKGLGYLFMAFSYLVKGPVGLVLCIIPIASFLALKRDVRKLVIFFVYAAVTCGLVAGLHLLALFFQGGEELVFRVLNAQILSRISGSANKPFYFYFFYLLVVFSPWWLLLGGLCVKKARSCIKQRSICFSGNDFNVFVVLMAVGTILPFLFATSRHGRYLLPVFPAISILFTCLLCQEVDASETMGRLNIITRHWKRVFVFISFLLVAIFFINHGKEPFSFLALVLLFTGVFLALMYFFARAPGTWRPIFLYGILIFVFAAGLTCTLEPGISKKESGRQFVMESEGSVNAAAGVFLFRFKPDGEGLKYALYSRFSSGEITFFKNEDMLKSLPKGAMLVVYEKDKRKVLKVLESRKYKIISKGYIHAKKVLSIFIFQ